MGIAMWSTLIGIFFTIAGACALDTGKNTVINTHWLWLKLRNETSGEVTQHLRARVWTCVCARACAWVNLSACVDLFMSVRRTATMTSKVYRKSP